MSSKNRINEYIKSWKDKKNVQVLEFDIKNDMEKKNFDESDIKTAIKTLKQPKYKKIKKGKTKDCIDKFKSGELERTKEDTDKTLKKKIEDAFPDWVEYKDKKKKNKLTKNIQACIDQLKQNKIYSSNAHAALYGDLYYAYDGI